MRYQKSSLHCVERGNLAIFQSHTEGMNYSRALLSREMMVWPVSYLHRWSCLAKEEKGRTHKSWLWELVKGSLSRKKGKCGARSSTLAPSTHTQPLSTVWEALLAACDSQPWEGHIVYYGHQSSLGGFRPLLHCPGSISPGEMPPSPGCSLSFL